MSNLTLAEKIRTHRLALGLTQTQLGQRLGVKTNAVSKWECGRVTDIPMSKIRALAALFDVSVSYLVDDKADSVRELLGLFHRLPADSQAQFLSQIQ